MASCYRPTSNVAMLSVVNALAVNALVVGAAMVSGPSNVNVVLRTRSSIAVTRRPPCMGCSLRALLFDCDGVLADTERDGHRISFNRVFAEKGFGFEWHVEEYGHLCEVGGGKERMTAYFNANTWPVGFESPSTAELSKGLPVDPDRLELVKGMHARKTELFQELIGSGIVPLRPGVLRLVDEAIEANVPIAVCSTSNEAAVRTLVQTLMGDQRYSAFSFFCGDAVQRKKPAPDVYLLAAEKLDVPPSQSVVIEDSGIGLRAAKAAGMACLVTISTYTAEEDFSGADRIVSSLGEPGEEEAVSLQDLMSLLS
mmetsp:Transcript_14117/g.23471  ORF Transcript_14117/g.23471 Transcript_14117/m.23471 type:complete len:312 (+) Transcript_14117:16-951(+)|eukprot:CAMPEP_0119312346 /NCGR_PEP_ID=MMETSP1333-20130426/26068_1 /TAXON_ID=418940 /ORGANISM="Scyphosphaera apsteinii, Strain RCC1455" /LENGTH=311 /DNA_ID=CAMNT_0007316953 /DNA_START=14 /DNA_END=949 /DNA_ORIENTATION=+